MKVKGLIYRLSEICNTHGIDESTVNVKFRDYNIDTIMCYDELTNTITLYEKDFLKKNS